MTAKTGTGLVAHARAQLGLPYLYGDFGRVCTPEIIMQKHRQYPKMTSAERAQRALKTHVGKRCYDCAGLIKSYWMQDSPTAPPRYIERYDKSAAGLKDCCRAKGPISTIPREPGILVFIGTHHVGVYDGRGNVIEARGFEYGVVERPLSAGKWDAWGRLDWLEGPQPVSMPGAFAVGDRVRVKPTAKHYYPGGPELPGWLRGKVVPVRQTLRGGRPELRGGVRCVLLGDGIETWCAVENLEKVV